ncbi:glycosyl hydrolase family 95 catalytic domain-containing protein [Streptomyces sp. IBSBF 2435]|uniref:glycosyl hydrolase family 95 catalytic domain-containing protein n=1 Tax=Streptomyces sp. IBSBF 2435 TaxID=2903531 RepID=UPI003FA79DB3
MPPYLINNDSGALAEWAWPDLVNKNNCRHRHSSGPVPVRPCREISAEKNPARFKATRVFLRRRARAPTRTPATGCCTGRRSPPTWTGPTRSARSCCGSPRTTPTAAAWPPPRTTATTSSPPASSTPSPP